MAMGEEKEEICRELDATVLEVMASLKRLASARDRYLAAVREVSIISSTY